LDPFWVLKMNSKGSPTIQIFCSFKMTPFGGSICGSIKMGSSFFFVSHFNFYDKRYDHPVWRALEKELVSGSQFGTILN